MKATPLSVGRRVFLHTAVAWTALSRRVFGSEPAQRAVEPWSGAVVQVDEGEFLVSGRRRAPMRIKIDSRAAAGATMSMLMSEVSPGANIPVHLHRNEDELIFIHTGEGVVTLGDRKTAVKPGAVLYAPRNVWHGIDNTGSTTVTWCAIYSPPGFEQYFREAAIPADGAGPGPAEIAKLAEKYGMVFRTP